MTITELQNLIQLENGNLHLDWTSLNSEAINTYIAPFFADNVLEIINAEQTNSAVDIRVSGTGNNLPLTGMAVTAIFSLDENGQAVAEIRAIGSETWKLASGFPLLAGSLFDKLFYTPEPELKLSSAAETLGEPPIPMRLTAELDDDSIFALLDLIFGSTSHELLGEITLSPDFRYIHEDLIPGPNIIVYGPEGATFDLGLFEVGEMRYEIFADSEVNYHSVTTQANVYLRLTGVLAFEAQGQIHSIIVGAETPNPAETVLFYADFTDASQVALDEVEALINGIAIDIPFEGIDILSLVVLTKVKLLVDASASSFLRYISLNLQTQEEWEIIPDLIYLQAIDLNFRVDNPLGADWSVSGIVSGLLAIGETGTLIMSIGFGNAMPPVFGGALREGDALYIQEIFRHFTGSGNDHVPDLVVTDFDFSLILASENQPAIYEGNIELEGEWEILSAPYLALQDIRFALNHPDEQTTKFIAYAVFVLQGVGIAISAEYHSPEKGWEFSGKTEASTPIPIGDLIATIAEDFGELSLPLALEGMMVDELGTTFNTGQKRFTFHAQISFPLDENNRISIQVDIDTYTHQFGGNIAISVPIHGESQILYFDIEFVGGTSSSTFVATYSHQAGNPVPQIKDIVAAFAPSLAAYIPDGISIDIRDVIFVFDKSANGSAYLFGIDIDALIDLSEIPLIGEKLPASQQVGVQPLQLLVASQAFSQELVQTINNMFPPTVNPLPSGGIIAQGFNIAAVLQLAGFSESLLLPSNNSPAAPVNQVTSPIKAQTDDGVIWYKVQRNLGPIHFERIGLSYKDNELWFLLDASLIANGLTIGMKGLGLGSSLSDFEPEFKIDGIGIDYSQAGFEIAGDFLKGLINYNGKDYPAYNGKVLITTSDLSLEAIGSYMQLDEGPSLFIYAILDYPLGGPAFFFVTGLAAGFGYNRRLLPPTVDKVLEFPLIQEAAGQLLPASSLSAEMARLQSYIPPSIGDYWFGIGVRFSSFKLIDSFILLTVLIGNEFEIDLYGLSTLVLPAPDTSDTGVTPLAELQLELLSSWVPDNGFFGIEAQLTSKSFLLSRNCHLTGGFAFYTWYAGEHDGDFVLSVGGYHPKFTKPNHYPTVPRLGFNWKIDSHFSIKGSAYYALTPSMLMGGMNLSATWVDGSLKAWFDTSIDILLSWKPYHYTAKFSISVGTSYTFHLFGTHHAKAHLDADLSIWGPEFSGRAHISWTVISFTISFGSDAATSPEPLDWTRFKTSFLPEPGEICSINVKSGLIRQSDANSTEATDDFGLINPKTLCIVTDSLIPASRAYAGNGNENALTNGAANTTIGFAAMNQQNVEVSHRILISRNGEDASDEFVYTPVTKNLPASIWGKNFRPSLHAEALVKDLLTGYELRAKPYNESLNNPTVSQSSLEIAPQDAEEDAFAWISPSQFYARAGTEEERFTEIQANIMQADVSSIRNEITQELLGDFDIDLSQFDTNNFFFAPQIAQLEG